eukprot:TRINITY_DN2885_c1_g1_i1.p1 TRINITY_DN2885_c1_g1~~TRINITY_DN2885_c1_g1_i1.p1  ORF type:complete len:221 (+),score=60.99 TRINITY_DN2885_c1_g1_i1:1102-1764(+)
MSDGEGLLTTVSLTDAALSSIMALRYAVLGLLDSAQTSYYKIPELVDAVFDSDVEYKNVMIMGYGRWLISAILLLIRAVFKLTVLSCDHTISCPSLAGSRSVYVESCMDAHVRLHLCNLYLIFTTIPLEWSHRYTVILTFKGKLPKTSSERPSTPPAPPSSPEAGAPPSRRAAAADDAAAALDWKVSHVHVVFNLAEVISHVPVIGWIHRVLKRWISAHF